MTRACGKAFAKSLSGFKVVEDMVKRAVDVTNPSLVKSLAKNREKLDDSFIDLCYNFENYKADVLASEKISEDTFNENGEDDGVAKYQYNDKWFEDTKNEYYDLVEVSDTKLEDSVPVDTTKEEKVNLENDLKVKQEKKMVDSLSSQVELLADSTSASIDKIMIEVRDMDDNSQSSAKIISIQFILNTLDNKLDVRFNDLVNQLICLLSDKEGKEKELMRKEYIKKEKIRIDNLLIMLAKKTKDVASISPSQSSSTYEKKEQTYLKKTDPPKWGGDPIEFADFVRKWKSQVSKANLPAESELDRLRESVPVQAAKALFGENDMSKAWKILEGLYGDKDLIANMLKKQLKNMKVKGKHDFDIVIELVTDVNNIALRLKALEMEEMLHVDNEFLSAVYRVLPSNSQTKWLEFDKSLYRSKWAAFTKFLEVARDQALQNKVLLSGYEKKDQDDTCHNCGGSGHRANKCPSTKGLRTPTTPVRAYSSAAVTPSEEAAKQEREKKARSDCGKCPLCKGRHTFFSAKEQDMWPADRFYRCESFKNQDIKDRAATLEKFGSCSQCTSWNHKKSACKAATKCRNFINNKICGGQHSSYVCGSGSAYCGALRCTRLSSSRLWPPAILRSTRLSSSSSNSSDTSSSESSTEDNSLSTSHVPDLNAETLLLFQDVDVKGATSPAFLCWDSGSTRCLVTHKFAMACSMRGQNIVYRLDVVGSKGDSKQGCYYMFELIQSDGTSRSVWAYGIDNIMEPADPVNIASVRKLFPHLPQEIFAPAVKKEVDILIGNNFLGLHPSGGQGRDSVGDMRAYQSLFGQGWVLAGSHPDLKPGGSHLTPSALNLARIYKCEIIPELEPSFWEGDCLGVLPPKRCGKCLRCLQCTDLALNYSRKDQDELEMLQKGVKLVHGKLQVSYPFVRDPHCLPNNRHTVIKMAEKQENRLIKSGHLERYNKEFQKYLDRGAAVKLTEQELEEYKGPINYISHHGVIQDSVTTPLRIVTNSSLKNGTFSLNECLARGPNSLNSMLGITLRFRCHEEGMVFDLTKAYNALKTGPIERNLRRFVWRFSPEDEWQDFAFDVVAFGDLPAANCLEIGRDLTADAGWEIDPVAARKIKDDSYVDDNVSGGNSEEVKRMKGERLQDGTFTGTMRQILDLGSLKMKVIVSTGETDEEVKHLIGNKVFGYHWNASDDKMAATFVVHLSNKKRKVRIFPALTKETLGLLDSTTFTKRICLGICNGFLDFMGIACPFTIRFKLLMRELYEGFNKDLKYDDSIPADKMEAWKNLAAEAVKSSSLFFPRCVKPAGALGNPLVAGFSDGAIPAFCGNIYLQWRIPCSHGVGGCDLDFEATLLWGKARVTPQSGYTAPRSELAGLVLVSRMALTTVKALQTESTMQPKGVILMADSECSIAAVDTTARTLKPFFHNRVSEIIENLTEMKKFCPVEDIHHVAGDLNPSDMGTRGLATVDDIGPGSFWQKGPSFLCSGRGLWPVTREFVRKELPDGEMRNKPAFLACLRATVMSTMSSSPATAEDINSLKKCHSSLTPDLWLAIEKATFFYNSIKKVLRILARLVKGWRMKSKKELLTPDTIGEPTAEEIATAERLLLLSAMSETASAESEGKLVSLCPQRDGAIIVSCGRIGEKSLSKLIGEPFLPILMPKSRAAYLYMVGAHEGEHGSVHCSIAETLARSRLKVWIVRARDLAKKICTQCLLCKRRNKVLAGQQMAKIKQESLTVCRPFSFVSLDFAGPVKVKGAVNARAKMKCWIVVYCCRATKAVELLPTCGYDTESFLLRHEEFVARHAAPATVVSDRGTQLVSAGRILAEKAAIADNQTPDKWDWSRITRENAASTWHFVPIGSPHFNGLPEATIKVLKKSLSLALHPGVELSYPELVTLLARISYSVNSRPLGLANISQSSQQEDYMLPLTPNHMLLARSSNVSPPMEYSGEDKFCARLAYVAQVEKDWWDRWIKQVLPTLFSYKRWKSKQENFEVGDLVMLQYPGHFKDDYCIAKVTKAVPDDDNLVRKVTVSYKKKNSRESPAIYKSKPLISEEVAIHRLHRLHLTDEELAGQDVQAVAGHAGHANLVRGNQVEGEDGNSVEGEEADDGQDGEVTGHSDDVDESVHQEVLEGYDCHTNEVAVSHSDEGKD